MNKHIIFYTKWATICNLILLVLVSCTLAQADIDMSVIAEIESSNRPNAYNKVSKATGMYQITPICLADFNERHKDEQFILNDMFVPDNGLFVADWYMNKRIPQLLRHYGYADTDENRLIGYNCGVGCLKRDVLPKETVNYIRKYQSRG